ncbi:MAG TPA: hypothetical protein VGI74_04285 [Streptosporangiaceae bacterium]
MDRIALTDAYLDAVKKNGASPAELLGQLPDSEFLNAFYTTRRYLCRPTFIGYEERDRLQSGVEVLRDVLVSLPDRLCGGDMAAFARAAGATDYQVSAVARSRGNPATRQARADMYLDESGFKLLELNIGSALGGMECADICRALLEHPVLAAFAAEHSLGFADTMREQVNDTLVESGFAPGSFPMVAVTDWPTSYHNRLGAYMHMLAGRWRELGLDAHACHVGELEYRNGRVWLHGRRVDIVARMFLLQYLLEPGAGEILDPLIDAAARGEVALFTSLDSELLASKMGLAMLSDDRNRHLFAPAELAAIDRIVPWTRAVRPGPVTLPDGSVGELMDYAVSHAGELVIKPTMLYGGQGVVPGWQDGMTRARWRDELAAACGGPYVLQQRIRPVPEPFPAGPGKLTPCIVTWGVFTVARGHGGIFTRAVTVESGAQVINAFSGAGSGCCLVAQPDPR